MRPFHHFKRHLISSLTKKKISKSNIYPFQFHPMEIDSGDWLADYGYMEAETVPVIDFGQPSPGFSWSPNPFGSSSDTSASVEVNCSFVESDSIKSSSNCRKRSKSESYNASGTKACREKVRRDRLNERFMELRSILEPGRTPKTDKAVILSDAVRTVTHLRAETEKLKESMEYFEERIKELKAEKNELRDEKQKLKADKEKLEQQLRATAFLPHPPPMSAMFSGQAAAKKLMPFVGFPGVSMWQFMPQSVVDTSQDHILRPPVA